MVINIMERCRPDGGAVLVSFLGAIVSWPVLLVANVCMT
jgi:hypothetical protein